MTLGAGASARADISSDEPASSVCCVGSVANSSPEPPVVGTVALSAPNSPGSAAVEAVEVGWGAGSLRVASAMGASFEQ